jgi:lysophospholipase L1-like esterase
MNTKRLVKFSVIGVLLVGLSAAYLYFWQSRPIGAGPAGPPVPIAPFSRAWSGKQFLLVGLGDSVTAGFGARHAYSYFDRLMANPPDEFAEMKGRSLRVVLPHLEYTNLAVSGSTSGQHLAKQLPLLPPAGSNVVAIVVMTTGGNDIIHNYGQTPPREQAMYGATLEQASPWIADFEKRLNSIVEQINAHFPGGCHIFVANIFDPTDGVGDIKHAGLPAWKDGLGIFAAYNDVIKRCAEKHAFVHLVDVRAAFLGHGIHCTQFWSAHYDSKDPHYWYFENLEDPNERGYDVIRRLFLLKIAAVGERLQGLDRGATAGQ